MKSSLLHRNIPQRKETALLGSINAMGHEHSYWETRQEYLKQLAATFFESQEGILTSYETPPPPQKHANKQKIHKKFHQTRNQRKKQKHTTLTQTQPIVFCSIKMSISCSTAFT